MKQKDILLIASIVLLFSIIAIQINSNSLEVDKNISKALDSDYWIRNSKICFKNNPYIVGNENQFSEKIPEKSNEDIIVVRSRVFNESEFLKNHSEITEEMFINVFHLASLSRLKSSKNGSASVLNS